MQNNYLRYKTIVWEVIFPLVLYYIVLLAVMYFSFAFVGDQVENYMAAQIVATVVTLPIMYFGVYRRTRDLTAPKPSISKQTILNAIAVIVIALCFSISLNNLISMSPLVEISKGYEQANQGFYSSTLALEIIGSGILTPILEELVFRGIIFANLKKVTSVVWSVVIGAFLFALIHFNLVQFTYALIIGVVLCLVMHKSKHVYAAIIGHMAANIFAVLRTEKGLLEGTVDGSAFAWSISAILLVVGIVLLVFYLRRGDKE